MTNNQRRRFERILHKTGTGGLFTVTEDQARQIFQGEAVEIPAGRGMVHQIYHSTPEASAAFQDMVARAFPHLGNHPEALDPPLPQNEIRAHRTPGGYTFQVPAPGGGSFRLVFPEGGEAVLTTMPAMSAEETCEFEESIREFFTPG
jgi:hypothetical protein